VKQKDRALLAFEHSSSHAVAFEVLVGSAVRTVAGTLFATEKWSAQRTLHLLPHRVTFVIRYVRDAPYHCLRIVETKLETTRV